MSESQNQERYEELLAGYVLGTLSQEELAEMRTLREAGLPPDALSVEEARELLAELPAGLASAKPSTQVRVRLLASIGPSKGFAFWLFGNPRTAALAWAAVVLISVVNAGILVALLNSQTNRVNQLRSELRQTQTDLVQQKRLNQLLGDPTIQVSNIQGTKTPCRGRIYFDPAAGRLVVCATTLPQLEAGRDYQLWVMIEGKPVSVGVLGTRDDGIFYLQVGAGVPLHKGGGFAISVEPKGGMPQPTGEIVMTTI